MILNSDLANRLIENEKFHLGHEPGSTWETLTLLILWLIRSSGGEERGGGYEGSCNRLSSPLWPAVDVCSSNSWLRFITSHHRSPGRERRKKKKEERKRSAIFPPWQDERRPSSIRIKLELFHQQHRGNFWETGWSACRPSRARRFYLLNWTELRIVTDWHCPSNLFREGRRAVAVCLFRLLVEVW